MGGRDFVSISWWLLLTLLYKKLYHNAIAIKYKVVVYLVVSSVYTSGWVQTQYGSELGDTRLIWDILV